MDAMKLWVVNSAKEALRGRFTGTSIDGMPVSVMRDVDPLSLQLSIKTPAGPRFFLAKFQEKY